MFVTQCEAGCRSCAVGIPHDKCFLDSKCIHDRGKIVRVLREGEFIIIAPGALSRAADIKAQYVGSTRAMLAARVPRW